MKKRKYLCPVDFSEAADNAIDYAANLAKINNAELVLLHIVREITMQDFVSTSVTPPPTIEQRKTIAKERLNNYCLAIEKEFNVSCKASVKNYPSNVSKAIKSASEIGRYDLIIMGTNGADDLNQFYFGTHTYDVIKRISCPLLMIPETWAYNGIKNIVYATDYHKDDIEKMKEVLELTKNFNTIITILHISQKPTAVSQDVFRILMSSMEEQLQGQQLRFKRLVEDDVVQGIEDYMLDNDADMLVILTHSQSFFKKISRKSITRKLSYIASYPVLVNQEEG